MTMIYLLVLSIFAYKLKSARPFSVNTHPILGWGGFGSLLAQGKEPLISGHTVTPMDNLVTPTNLSLF